MKVELVIDDNVRIPVSYEMLEAMVDRFPVTEANIEQLEVLADHPCSDVRVSLAGKDKITQTMFSKLLATGDNRILQALIDTSDAQTYFDMETLEGLIKQSSFARSIAQNVEKFSTDDSLVVALASHSDPSVREGLAGNYSAPKKAVKTLVKDADAAVAKSAASTLG